MISKTPQKNDQIQMVSIDQLVPQDHLLRKIDNCIDFSFIYDLVEDKYCPDNGRPSIDPVTLIKIPLIQYMYGIKSMRQTIKEIEVNMAYRWFLGLDFYDKVPHFSTFGKNYKRRFEGTDLFEQIFQNILMQCMKKGLVDTSLVFVDSTHVKACANRKKAKSILVAKKAARAYDEALKEEINKDRQAHGKKPLKEKEEDKQDEEDPSRNRSRKVSLTDPESGWFHKGEHKEVFAYNIQAACDKHGWMLSYSIHPGNENDSTTFPAIYEKIKELAPKMIVMDAGYKTPAIAKKLLDDEIAPLMPYKRPQTKKGYFRKHEYIYDEYYDCYICPNDQILSYRTTNREGYREYKSDGEICAGCPYLAQCTQSKEHVKTVTRHVWEGYMEKSDEIRYRIGSKEIYEKRKETIERNFGTAKEHHGMRYTQQIGREKMAMKVGLTFACLNMKKLARILCKAGPDTPKKSAIFIILKGKIEKMKMKPRKTPDDHTICPGFVYGLNIFHYTDDIGVAGLHIKYSSAEHIFSGCHIVFDFLGQGNFFQLVDELIRPGCIFRQITVVRDSYRIRMANENYRLIAWLLFACHYGYHDLPVPWIIFDRYKIQLVGMFLVVVHLAHKLIHFIAHGNFIVCFDDTFLGYQCYGDFFDSFAQFSIHFFPPDYTTHLK